MTCLEELEELFSRTTKSYFLDEDNFLIVDISRDINEGVDINDLRRQVRDILLKYGYDPDNKNVWEEVEYGDTYWSIWLGDTG